MVNDLETAKKIVAEYDELVTRALEIVRKFPYSAYIRSKIVQLDFDDDGHACLMWSEYESDWEGGGLLVGEGTSFPAAVLFLSDEELAEHRARAQQEEAEKQAKVRAEQEARSEAKDRAEFARLLQKYGMIAHP